MPRLEEWEIKKYWEIFQGLKPEGNKLTGEKVSPVLKNLRLSDSQLSQIWDLADIDADGKLDFEEFCITMRLIFDLVNGKAQDVPSSLPGWLVPSSKAHLIQANMAVATGNSGFDDDDDLLLDDFDWYISPTDRATYEAIYNNSCDGHGRIRFDSLNGLYTTLSSVPRADVTLAWNLVNPKLYETIDKDQVMVLLHILNQRESGKRIPRGVPALLRATFSKSAPSYDLNEQAPRVQPSANDKKTFGLSYLDKIHARPAEKGTDFSLTRNTDMEEVRLRRELADLERKLDSAQQEATPVVKHEFEQLLKYMRDAVVDAKRTPDKTLSDARSDVALIGSQVQMLQDFLAEKESELTALRAQLDAP